MRSDSGRRRGLSAEGFRLRRLTSLDRLSPQSWPQRRFPEGSTHPSCKGTPACAGLPASASGDRLDSPCGSPGGKGTQAFPGACRKTCFRPHLLTLSPRAADGDAMNRGGEGNRIWGVGGAWLPTPPRNSRPFPCGTRVLADIGSCRGRGYGRGLDDEAAFFSSLLGSPLLIAPHSRWVRARHVPTQSSPGRMSGDRKQGLASPE
jgi:hypothetical protein